MLKLLFIILVFANYVRKIIQQENLKKKREHMLSFFLFICQSKRL